MWDILFGTAQFGAVQRVVADQNLGRDIEALYGTENRLVNPGLAGSALLECEYHVQISERLGKAKRHC
jgi:hypothetical protein